MRDFDPLFEVADVDSGRRLVGSKEGQGYVSECNDTYVALGGGPPVSADMVNIVVIGGVVEKRSWGGGSACLELAEKFRRWRFCDGKNLFSLTRTPISKYLSSDNGTFQ